MLDRLQVVAVGRVQRSVARLHDGWIVEALTRRVLQVPRRRHVCPLVGRDGHREPIPRTALLVVVDHGQVAARQRDRLDAAAGVGQRRRGDRRPVRPPSVDSLRWMRCADVPSRKNATSRPSRSCTTDGCSDAEAGHGPRKRPRLPAIARDRHRRHVEVLVGERHQEGAVLQRDGMHARHPSQPARERIVEPIEQARARAGCPAGSDVPLRRRASSAALRDELVDPVRLRHEHARAIPAWRARAFVVGRHLVLKERAAPRARRDGEQRRMHEPQPLLRRRCRAQGCCPTRRRCRR